MCVHVVDVFRLESRLPYGSLHGQNGPPPIRRRLRDVMRVSCRKGMCGCETAHPSRLPPPHQTARSPSAQRTFWPPACERALAPAHTPKRMRR